MPDVLNDALYSRLKRLFGRVIVSAQGEAMQATGIRDIISDEPMLSIAHAGEYYRVNCFVCRDTRARLYVSHMFGKRDIFGRRMTFLAWCFNEGCLYKPEHKADFLDRLDDSSGWVELASIRKGADVNADEIEVLMPGPCIPIGSLPPAHPARAYLEVDRGFDVSQLNDVFKVSYCTDSHYFLAKNRLIFPVYDRGKLRGWQARYVGELPWKTEDRELKRSLPPKYFTTPTSKFKSRCLYNFDHMKEWETGVIVEGPTDVWRFGSMSGCVFGNYVSDIQKRRLRAVFSRRTLVLLLDPEEFGKRSTRKFVDDMTVTMPGRFCAVKLPDGTDPGGLDRTFLKEYVREQAAEQGVKVVYRKVKT